MRGLVRHHRGYSLQLEMGRPRRVGQQGVLAVGDAPEILHGSEGEVGDGDVVELAARVRDLEISGKETHRVARHLRRVSGQVRASREGDYAQGDVVHHDRVGQGIGADHEGHQIRRHHHGLSERHSLAPVAEPLDRADLLVGYGGQLLVDDEGNGESSLEVRFVPAGKRPPGVGGLELGGGDDLVDAVVAPEGTAIEAAQSFVEYAGEHQVQAVAGTGRQVVGERDGQPLLGAVELDCAGMVPPARRHDPG